MMHVSHTYTCQQRSPPCKYVRMLLICIASSQAVAETIIEDDAMDFPFFEHELTVVLMIACTAYLPQRSQPLSSAVTTADLICI